MEKFVLEFEKFRIELGPETCIMGILNITPDSFSDGSKFNTPHSAFIQGMKLVKDGAQILDIGGESSRPFARSVSEQEEIDRVVPVIKRLSDHIDVPISIDTVKTGVAKAALDAGASMINDISSFEQNPDMADLASQRDVPVVLMHMKGTPETMQINPDYDDLMLEIAGYLMARAAFAMEKGIKKERIILDPGIGFGKTTEDNLVIINRLEKIKKLGFPVLIGPSRKSFIRNILGKKENKAIGPDSEVTEYGTLAAVGASVSQGAHIIRVHDVQRAKPFISITDAIRNA